jgi:hypothetical protein
LNSPHVRLVGVNVKQDINKIDEHWGLLDGRICKWEDVGTISRRLGVVRARKGCSLQHLVQILLTKHLKKDDDVRLSDWRRDVLKEDQIKYAILDAIASLYVALRSDSSSTSWQ